MHSFFMRPRSQTSLSEMRGPVAKPRYKVGLQGPYTKQGYKTWPEPQALSPGMHPLTAADEISTYRS